MLKNPGASCIKEPCQMLLDLENFLRKDRSPLFLLYDTLVYDLGGVRIFSNGLSKRKQHDFSDVTELLENILNLVNDIYKRFQKSKK